ncbi:MAG TPA: hypothetical protein ACFYD4_03295, partial [Candidatus Wunengus sp. YC61]|uniref:hypothetical protein n=1 Tax=Candidatus Wunengus sp. YC61 TaxID=3367698 RepID=UPI004026E603
MGLVDTVYQEQSNNSLVDTIYDGTITPKKVVPITPTELPFEAKHPTLYALGKSLMDQIPGGQYAYQENRTAFSKLPQQLQTRQLLKDTLEAETLLAFPKLLEGVGNVVSSIGERFFPKATSFLTKPLGKVNPKINPIEPLTTKPVNPETNSLVDQVYKPIEKDIAQVDPTQNIKGQVGDIQLGATEVKQPIGRYDSTIADIRDQISSGEPGKRTSNAQGDPIVFSSSYPSFMKNKDWT